MKRLRLGVNIDHVATLRQARGGLVPYPDILEAAQCVKAAGADHITVHLRMDRRHIQDSDLDGLMKLKALPINLEMGATEEMLGIALKAKPFYVCLVPEKREELTTEGGLDVMKNIKSLKRVVHACRDQGIKVSTFIEADADQIRASADIGVDAVEIHTGTYANAKSDLDRKESLVTLAQAFKEAYKQGIHVHAGHGLDYENVKPVVELDYLEEVNIGHSIVCRSVFVGLKSAVEEMLALL